MPKDWKDISDDEILNDDVSNTARIARYQRLMKKRTSMPSINSKIRSRSLWKVLTKQIKILKCKLVS